MGDPATRGDLSPVDADGTAGLDRRLADAIERLGHALRAMGQQHARAAGLSPLQEQALLAIGRQPEIRRGAGGLAAEFDVTAPTMSDAVAALVRKGLVASGQGADGRRRVLTLTEEGSALAVRATGWDGQLIDALTTFDERSKGQCLELLLNVIGQFAERGVIGAARVCTTCRFFQRNGSADGNHHCDLLEIALPMTDLRTDCPEHELLPYGPG